MKLVLVASICHAVSGMPAPVCHEEIALNTYEGSPQTCMFAQAILAQWKANSKYADDEWSIGKFKCVFGIYEKKDAL